jgi:hypothetical protein
MHYAPSIATVGRLRGRSLIALGFAAATLFCAAAASLGLSLTAITALTINLENCLISG